jgi:hypothetical protein
MHDLKTRARRPEWRGEIRTNGSNPAHRDANRKGTTTECAEVFALASLGLAGTLSQIRKTVSQKILVRRNCHLWRNQLQLASNGRDTETTAVDSLTNN